MSLVILRDFNILEPKHEFVIQKENPRPHREPSRTHLKLETRLRLVS